MKKISKAKAEQPTKNQMILSRVSFERYSSGLECNTRDVPMPSLAVSCVESNVDGRAHFTGRQDGKFLEVSVVFNKQELDAIEAIAKGAIKRVNSSINSN